MVKLFGWFAIKLIFHFAFRRIQNPKSQIEISSFRYFPRMFEIKRVFPLTNAVPAAVVLRGRPDQMSLVETMVSKFNTQAAGNNPPIQ